MLDLAFRDYTDCIPACRLRLASQLVWIGLLLGWPALITAVVKSLTAWPCLKHVQAPRETTPEGGAGGADGPVLDVSVRSVSLDVSVDADC